MHGLGNFGIAGHAVLKTMCGYDPAKLVSFACRFSAPVFPGETLRTEMWRDGAVVSFRTRVVERDVDRRQQRPRRGQIVNESAELAPIREAVRALCADFPGEYWRALDRERAYPDKFVAALTKAGFLAALIPEEYGGSGLTMSAAVAIMEEIQASGCNGAACHAQMYTMGTVLRHGSAEQKARYLPGIARGELRLQAFGVTEPTSGTDTLSLRTTAVRDGDQLRDQRPENLDFARRAFRSHAATGAHHAARAGEIAHRGPVGLSRRHARGQGATASPSGRSAP